MQRVIAVANQKGGVAKTTTALNVAAGLASRGDRGRVLLIDLDPQANATMSLPIDLDVAEERNVCQVLDRSLRLGDVVQSAAPRLDVVPSHIALASLEPSLSAALAAYRLQEALETVEYDFVVLDCPPSLGGLTTNALVAATHVIVPVKPSTYGLSGVGDFMNTFKLVQKRMNARLTLLGVAITMLDSRTTLSKDVISYLEGIFGDKLFKARIRMNVRLDEAVSAQESIFEFSPSSTGAEDYGALLDEVMARVG